jgi:hypothetical protein
MTNKDKLEQALRQLLPKLEGIPIKWDRYLVMDDERYGGAIAQIYGWIKRENDPTYDFVLLNISLGEENFDYGATTSSKKYSKQIAQALDFKEHNECISANDLYIKGEDLIEWQRRK